ncbi:MAG: response regulator [Deltaproteobacteria bacterium]|jgi:putative two-component system response regulator|nr:response regulator [Deltaproteobacteria bacterium]
MVKRSILNLNNSVIFIVDDSLVNLEIAKESLPKTYEVFALSSAKRMFKLLAKKKPDLILLDIQMPEMDGFEAINILKNSPEDKDIPVIFFSSLYDEETIQTGLALGAVEFVTKPVLPKLLQKTVELHLSAKFHRQQLENQTRILEQNRLKLKEFEDNFQQLVEKQTQQVLDQHDTVLSTVSKLIDYRLDSSVGKEKRSHKGLSIMIQALRDKNLYQEQVSNWDLDLMLQSASLHDVGKLALSGELLAKPGKLTNDEYEEIKRHPKLGVQLLNQVEARTFEHALLKYAKVFAETHQEKWDGTGYPAGLSGEAIPLPGRLMAINDVYQALTAHRPYKNALSHEEAVKVIIAGKGTHFDPVLVSVFSEVADQFQTLEAINT